MKDYKNYKAVLTDQPFPYAVLDIDLFQQNIQTNLDRSKDKKIRIASKSLRCAKAMRMILDYSNQFQGIMTYSGQEVLYLIEQGFDDLLMGYPIVEQSLLEDIAKYIKKGKQICLMVDSLDHLNILNLVGKNINTKIPICIDIDLSDNYPGLRFGVWRSSIFGIDQLNQLLQHIRKMDFLHLDGLMGYEAQVAGVADNMKGKNSKNRIIRWLKNRSIKQLQKNRKAAVALIESQDFKLRFVNGGGTGSLETTTQEEVVTEVTVGSGFYNAHYFDNYNSFKLKPALFYAIPIVRKPTNNIFTCHGGGFIASGGIEKIKAPIVHLPKTGTLDTLEGAGEVQTPIRFSNLQDRLDIGDPIFMRHAKSGELCERFNQLIFLEEDKISKVNTYRGDHYNFG